MIDLQHIPIKEDYVVINLMTVELLKRIKMLAAQGKIKQMYWMKIWKHLRKDILDYDHNECQICKAEGGHARAEMVHHINYLETHPELGLSSTYIDKDGRTYRQLISLCDECHKSIHLHDRKVKIFMNEERW